MLSGLSFWHRWEVDKGNSTRESKIFKLPSCTVGLLNDIRPLCVLFSSKFSCNCSKLHLSNFRFQKCKRQHRGLNPGPLHYEWSALPLSYTAFGYDKTDYWIKMRSICDMLMSLLFDHKRSQIMMLFILLGLSSISNTLLYLLDKT